MGLGERFRAAREERGLTLSEVGEQLRIRSVYLSAIEEENWKAIGAPVYIRGFLRTYARFLGLDPEEAVGEFNTASGAVPSSVPAVEIRAPGQRSMKPLLWIAGIVAIALIGFVIYVYVSPPRAVTTAQQSAAPAASPTASAATAHPSPRPQPLLTRTLALKVVSASWLRVTIDGKVSMEGIFPRGTSKIFHGKSALVRAGNAAGVQLTVNGKPAPKLGGVGDVAEKSFSL
ncbi:MAG TPA: RodZ domain-containing protein [Candidatus Rubrimentiphilum sp.]|nr:RodZ domain-containing protein [Candidatus Rubrimentiphilum sp.]